MKERKEMEKMAGRGEGTEKGLKQGKNRGMEGKRGKGKENFILLSY